MRHGFGVTAAWLAGVAGLAGCAHAPPKAQTIEVRVDAPSPAWAGPLACEARNAEGAWPFSAPGRVTVMPSGTPLQITCQAPAGAVAEPSVTAASAPSARERAAEGRAAGAKVGAGAGVALGAAAVPMLGGAFAIAIAAGAVLKGGEIGGLVGALGQGNAPRYPSPLVLHVHADPAAPGSD